MNYIVSKLSSGLIEDKEIIQQYIKATHIDPKEIKSAKCNIIIYIEHIPSNYKLMEAKKRIWFPNQEIIYDYDIKAIPDIDIICCKTKRAVHVIKKAFPKVKDKIFYTSFDSIQRPIKPKLNYAIHPAGSSTSKGTLPVLRCWNQAAKIPILITTHFTDKTYNQFIVKKIQEETKSYKKSTFMGIETLNKGLIHYTNKHIPKAEFDTISTQAKYLILPSFIEGFGHTLNAARMMKQLTITTDAPPMNELFSNKSSMLVKSKKNMPVQRIIMRWIPPEIDEYVHFVSDNDLIEKIKQATSLSDVEYNNYINNAFDRYNSDKELFTNSMKKLFG